MAPSSNANRGKRRRVSTPAPSVQIIILLACMALLVVGFGLQNTLVSIRAGLEEMPDIVIGLIMSAFFLGFVVGSIFVPKIVQRVGHIRAFAALASVGSAVALAYSVFVEPITWILLRLLHGACYAGLLVVVESWLNTATPKYKRGRVLAIYGFVLYGAWAASQPLLQISPPSGFALFILVSICLSVALVPITLSRTGGPGVVEATRPKLQRLYQLSPLALMGVFIVGLSSSAFFGMAPRFAQILEFSDGAIAGFISLFLIGAVVLQWPLGWLSDIFDRRLVVIGGATAGTALALILAIKTQGDQTLLIGLAFCLGAFVLPLYSICIAQMNDQIEEGEVITVASGLLLVFGVGSTVGPLSASLLMGPFGPEGLFLFIALAMALYSLYALVDVYGLRRTPKMSQSEKDEFVAMPQTSHSSANLNKHSSSKAKGKKAPR